MEKIALITDSACDLSIDFTKKNNIKMVPFKIIFSDRDYDDGIDQPIKMLPLLIVMMILL